MAIREGRWDCPTCGTAGVPGRRVGCPSCGTPRPDGVRFYLPQDAPEVTYAGLLAQARAGADWICEHCGASARAAQDDCPGCGAARGSSPQQDTHEYEMDEIPRSARDRRRAADTADTAVAETPPKPRRRWKAPIFFAALLAGVAWWNSPKEVAATIDGKDWTRAIEVQEHRTVTEEDWSVPQGGRTRRSFRAVRSHRRVLDHHETRTRQVSERVQTGTRTYTCGSVDRGNGYFEDRICTEPQYETRYRTETYEEPVYRQEPIYGTKYVFDIERWLPDDTAWARGDAAREPEWPAVKIGRKEREGARIQRYVLRFTDAEGKSYEREVSQAEYDRYERGQPVRLKVRRGGTGQPEIVDEDAAAS